MYGVIIYLNFYTQRKININDIDSSLGAQGSEIYTMPSSKDDKEIYRINLCFENVKCNFDFPIFDPKL